MEQTIYSKNDYRSYLEHSWGKKPEQKAAEKAYNAKYYLENKARILAKRAGNASSSAVSSIGDKLGAKERREAESAADKANERYDELRSEGKTHSDATDDNEFRKSAVNAQIAIAKYNKTPLGKAESAVNKGRAVINTIKSSYTPYSEQERNERKAERKRRNKSRKSFSINIGGKDLIEFHKSKKK